MKEVKRSVLKEPSTIVHSMMPSSVMAGRMEYLSPNQISERRDVMMTHRFPLAKHCLRHARSPSRAHARLRK